MVNPPIMPHDMRQSMRWINLSIASCLLGVLATSVQAEVSANSLIASPEPGWPQWRGPRRDGVSDERGLLQGWPQGGPKLLWRLDGLGAGWSSPIIVGERIYITGDVGDDLVVYALDTAGVIQWRVKNGLAWKTPYPGARACCAYSAGWVYNLNAHGRLACLDAASGQEQWAVDILERFKARNITWALSECLLVDGPRVIVTPGGTEALMAGLDKCTGEILWRTEPLKGDRTSHSSPILFRYAGRRIIANCSSAHGFGVDADTGRLLWTIPLKNPHGVNVSTPIYGSGCVFFTTPYAEHGRLYRLLSDGQGMSAEHVWTSPIDAVTGCGVFIGDTLFVSGYRDVKWWMGIDWQTGKTRCEMKGLTTGAAIYADQRLYVLDERGTTALLKPGPDSLEVVSQFQLTTEQVRDAWTHPVLLDGCLYLRYHDTLWCYDVRQQP